MRNTTVKVCKPVIRGLRTHADSLHVLGKWHWATKCGEHDTSWQTTGPGRFLDALAMAQSHQREFAEMNDA